MFDYYTEAINDRKKRCIGNIVIDVSLNSTSTKVIGFENHGGQTFNISTPFGNVLYGNGNKFGDTHEGFFLNNVIGTYLHGPLLSKNPELADYIIKHCLNKKYNENTILEPLDDKFENSKKHDNKLIKNELNKIFIDIGVPCHLKGYNYLLTGISEVCNNINLLDEVTKKLYPSIARKCGTTASRVEQSIRHVIKVTWMNGNQKELEKIFGIRAKRRPCNSEFISKMADILSTSYY